MLFRIIFLGLGLVFSHTILGQHTLPLFNPGFEIIAEGKAAGWDRFGNKAYHLTIDSVQKRTGRYSTRIAYSGDSPSFAAASFVIPASPKGKKITLTGYIKTDSVRDGYAGLWLRIDPNIGFDNMGDRGVKGSTDWQKYSLTLDLNPGKTVRIVYGGLLVGMGKMWLDDLELTIDGKPPAQWNLFERKLVPADLDTGFQTASGLQINRPDSVELNGLLRLGEIWGLVKYYHPSVAQGKYNIDAALFRLLPRFLELQSTEAQEDYLLDWLNQLEDPGKAGSGIPAKADIRLAADFNWMEAIHSPRLKEKLESIRNASRPGEQYYVQYGASGNASFVNERRYDSLAFPDDGVRLLSVYRFWNCIQYFFPYRNLLDENWELVLREFIPKIINAANAMDYASTMEMMVARIHDTHANLRATPALTHFYGERAAPYSVRFVEGKALITDYLADSSKVGNGPMPGDIITSINGETVDQWIKKWTPYFPASNQPTRLRNMSASLLRTNDSVISIGYLHQAVAKETSVGTLMRNELSLRRSSAFDTSYRLLDGNIAYIDNGLLKTLDLPAIWQSLQHSVGLIIDDRNYPSDFPIYHLSAYLMPDRIPFVRFSFPVLTAPGYFQYNSVLTVGKKHNKSYYKGKIAILVNETTQSSAEFHAMAYRVHPNAVVMGSTTAGADGNVTEIYLPGGLFTWITGLGTYYPNGDETQRIGIVPDIEVKPTIEGVRAGRDEVLEKAIQLILSGN